MTVARAVAFNAFAHIVIVGLSSGDEAHLAIVLFAEIHGKCALTLRAPPTNSTRRTLLLIAGMGRILTEDRAKCKPLSGCNRPQPTFQLADNIIAISRSTRLQLAGMPADRLYPRFAESSLIEALVIRPWS